MFASSWLQGLAGRFRGLLRSLSGRASALFLDSNFQFDFVHMLALENNGHRKLARMAFTCTVFLPVACQIRSFVERYLRWPEGKRATSLAASMAAPTDSVRIF